MTPGRQGAFVSAHAIRRSAQQHQEFIADVDDALTSFGTTLQAMLVRARTERRRRASEQDSAEDALRQLQAEHDAHSRGAMTPRPTETPLRGFHAAGGAGSDVSLREARLKVQLAGQRHAAATGAVRLLEVATQDLARAGSAYRNRIRSLEEQSRKDLGFFFAAVESYTALAGMGGAGASGYGGPYDRAGSRSGDAGAAATVAGSSAAPGGRAVPLSEALAERGMGLVPTEQCSFSDNPITSWAKTAKSDIMWACETWETKVAPAVARGATREALEHQDAVHGAEPVSMRRWAGVWDTFLGNDPITVRRQEDGSFYVENGRHRAHVFQELGIEHMPARIAGGKT